MVQSRETMTLAGGLHSRQLGLIEFRFVDVSPVEGGPVHREAWSDGAVRADDDVVLPGATVPLAKVQLAVGFLDNSWHRGEEFCLVSVALGPITIPAVLAQIEPGRHTHKGLDLLQAWNRIHHLITGFVFLDQPIDQRVDLAPVFRPDVGGVVVQVLKVVILFEHWSLIDVVVGSNPMLVGVFGELSDILHIVAADVDVEKDEVSVYVLLPQNVLEILLRGNEGFGQAWLEIPRVQRKIEYRYAGVAKAVCNVGAEQTPVRGDVDPEAFLRRVINDFMNEFRPQQRLATHQRQDPAAIVVQPVDRTAGHVLGHTLDLIVVGPAIPTIEIALVLDKQIGGDGVELSGQNSRTDVRAQPSA